MKRFAEWRYFALILSAETCHDMYSSLKKYRKQFVQSGVRSIPIEMPIGCSIVTFITFKE